MAQMGGMGQMGGSVADALLSGQGSAEAQAAPTMDMSSWAAVPDEDGSTEQARAIQEAVAATQQAQYMQQVQFLQQARAHDEKRSEEPGHSTASGQSRFRDDY